jgi:hypothetical protein
MRSKTCLNARPERDRGKAGEHEVGRQAQLGRVAALAHGGERAADELDQVLAEVEQHRQQRAQVQRDVEGDVVGGIPPAEQPVRKGQMGRRRDRKEFAQALDHAEDRRLQWSHGART